ncbi:serine hydrolase domain-containing protein [Streptomyces sp. NPDC048419]|uniref:serine hydrolase domain-containing protein n=1 Tax=Streptomyces sp. NPDC048419 TaxID=3365547 RepID=UPI00371D6066
MCLATLGRTAVADPATAGGPTVADHMPIAGTAKAFSGAVALSLVDRDALRLDETLGERLPQLPAAWHRVTLRQLLNHTGGLPDYSQAPAFRAIVSADPRHHFDNRRLLDFVADQPLNFPPGSQYRRSNSDNTAVALMAEAATGTPYEQLLRTLVYRPLDPAGHKPSPGLSDARAPSARLRHDPAAGGRQRGPRRLRPLGRREGSSPRRPT